MREITSINLVLTTWCNMACTDCCLNIPYTARSDKSHVSWEYLESAAKFLYGVERINATGGEPSLHPKFVEFVPKLKALFGAKKLSIETNGYGFEKFPETYRHFDGGIFCSRYTKDSFENSPDNTHKIEFIKKYFDDNPGTFKPEFTVGLIDFVPRSRVGGSTPCHRAYGGTVAYANSLLYPCCVGPGLPTKHGIPLTANWREEIVKAYMPCNGCFFALD